MARKAESETEAAAQDAAETTPVSPEKKTHTERTEDSLAPAGEGEEAEVLKPAVSAGKAPRQQGAEESTPQEPSAPDEATNASVEIVVTCRNPGGRRRAGRRWPEGETRLPAGTLSDFDLQVLRADPMFSVEG